MTHGLTGGSLVEKVSSDVSSLPRNCEVASKPRFSIPFIPRFSLTKWTESVAESKRSTPSQPMQFPRKDRVSMHTWFRASDSNLTPSTQKSVLSSSSVFRNDHDFRKGNMKKYHLVRTGCRTRIDNSVDKYIPAPSQTALECCHWPIRNDSCQYLPNKCFGFYCGAHFLPIFCGKISNDPAIT